MAETKLFHKVLLTFDTEDFINDSSIKALHIILRLLRKYDFKALFFITGHKAEKLSNFPEILDLLRTHEIGYHSSSHSVRPTIFEYTDVKNYEEAYLTSIKRETAHINPLTGEIEGKGGILFLRDLFPNKKILSFKAPGCCWSPPHLESLAKLGIKFDFSADLSQSPVYFKGISFYPRAIIIDGLNRSVYLKSFRSILKNKITVLGSHPSFYVNQLPWGHIYFKGNPRKLLGVPLLARQKIESLFLKLELLLKWIKLLQRMKLIEVTPCLRRSRIDLEVTKMVVHGCYERSVVWPRFFFGYEPKFLRSHFFHYFNIRQIDN